MREWEEGKKDANISSDFSTRAKSDSLRVDWAEKRPQVQLDEKLSDVMRRPGYKEEAAAAACVCVYSHSQVVVRIVHWRGHKADREDDDKQSSPFPPFPSWHCLSLIVDAGLYRAGEMPALAEQKSFRWRIRRWAKLSPFRRDRHVSARHAECYASR